MVVRADSRIWLNRDEVNSGDVTAKPLPGRVNHIGLILHSIVFGRGRVEVDVRNTPNALYRNHGWASNHLNGNSLGIA